MQKNLWEILIRPAAIKTKINILESELLAAEYNTLPGAIDYSADRVITTPQNSHEEKIVRALDLQKEICDLREMLNNAEHKAALLIQTIPSDTMQHINWLNCLSYRFLRPNKQKPNVKIGWYVEEIAEEMGVDERTIRRWTEDGLNFIQENYNI